MIFLREFATNDNNLSNYYATAAVDNHGQAPTS